MRTTTYFGIVAMSLLVGCATSHTPPSESSESLSQTRRQTTNSSVSTESTVTEPVPIVQALPDATTINAATNLETLVQLHLSSSGSTNTQVITERVSMMLKDSTNLVEVAWVAARMQSDSVSKMAENKAITILDHLDDSCDEETTVSLIKAYSLGAEGNERISTAVAATLERRLTNSFRKIDETEYNKLFLNGDGTSTKNWLSTQGLLSAASADYIDMGTKVVCFGRTHFDCLELEYASTGYGYDLVKFGDAILFEKVSRLNKNEKRRDCGQVVRFKDAIYFRSSTETLK